MGGNPNESRSGEGVSTEYFPGAKGRPPPNTDSREVFVNPFSSDGRRKAACAERRMRTKRHFCASAPRQQTGCRRRSRIRRQDPDEGDFSQNAAPAPVVARSHRNPVGTGPKRPRRQGPNPPRPWLIHKQENALRDSETPCDGRPSEVANNAPCWPICEELAAGRGNILALQGGLKPRTLPLAPRIRPMAPQPQPAGAIS